MSGPPYGQPPGTPPGGPPLNPPGYPGGPGNQPGYPQPSPYYGGEGARPIVIGNRTYILAPYLDRVLAFLVDNIILSVPGSVAGACAWVLMMIMIAASGNKPDPAIFIIFGLFFLAVIAGVTGLNIWYWCFFITREMWSTGVGQTLGCKVMKIKIIKQDGSEIRPMDGFLRWIGFIVSSMAFYLGFLWIVIDDQNRGWHDSIASTYVVKV
jgi:uncharacterized RDD family membrane protein YckC